MNTLVVCSYGTNFPVGPAGFLRVVCECVSVEARRMCQRTAPSFEGGRRNKDFVALFGFIAHSPRPVTPGQLVT
jgi:hypothetical protein